ncbi:HNH endonuclease signature motif containing protein [Rhodococcus cercidiphylli]|uniref:HNH endonuclease signature motif containing protein n=1 Tax=Rhodococcus cercidiphylli TaxID=489916 RepID=A0ABU4B1Y6_9NOCA|nr:HNH endonuclease signature motif containing protein [Rhodococcus cercidiphylli]MDV6232491.1 HNH endonuclease signature motif containing protein [Rhodococcus cercidiphylli]
MKTWGDVFGLGDQELVSELAGVSSLENELAATRLTLLAEMDRRGLAMKLGYSSVTRWYARSVRITDGSAARQMELGQWLTDRPSVLNALAGGDIHAAHASAIADGYATVVVADPTLDEQRREAVVAELLETAMRSTAGQVASRAQALAHSAAEDARARHEQAEEQRQEQERTQERDRASRADAGGAGGSGGSGDSGGSGEPEPAGPEPVPAGPPPIPVSENSELNRFDVHPLASGRFQMGGNVDRLLAEKLLTALSALTAPQPGPGGERDLRGPSKRRADALDRILDRHLSGGGRGSAGGSRASVHLIVPLRDLLADRGHTQSNSATTGSTTDGSGGDSRAGDTDTGPVAGADGGHHVSESPEAGDSLRTGDVDAGPVAGADGGHYVGCGAGDSSRARDTEAGPDRGTGRRVSGSNAGAGGSSRARDTDVGPDRGNGRRVSGSGAGAGDVSRTGDTETPPVAGTDGGHYVGSGAGAGDVSRTGDTETPPAAGADGGHQVSESAGAGDGSWNGDPRGDRVGPSAGAGDHCGRKSAPDPGDADWPFHFDWTGPMSRAFAELLTCDADLTPIIVDHHGVPLALGRTTRLASDDQRIALTIRDRCCVMCGRPAQWCQAHHVKFWEHGGRTDLNNLALVCGECHRLVHHGDWQLLMGDDGHPYAIPPESIDSTRQPIPSYHRRKRRAA